MNKKINKIVVNIQYLKVLTKKNYKLYQLVPMRSSWVTVALQLRVSILTSLWKEPAIVQFYIQRVLSSWLPYPIKTRSEKAHVRMKVLFQGDGTFSASMDALPLTVFTKMEDTAKSKMTLQRNISAPTKWHLFTVAISIPTVLSLFITLSLYMQLYFRNRHGYLWLLNGLQDITLFNTLSGKYIIY